MFVLIVVLLLLLALWLFTVLWLGGEDLRRFDRPTGEEFVSAGPHSPAQLAVLERLRQLSAQIHQVPLWRRLPHLRTTFDELFAEREFPTRFVPVQAAGVAAEWVLAEHGVAQRRLLYIHGGAFAVGSPRSHRSITSRLAQLTGSAVLAIDYRMLPEHSRLAGIEDCRSAYRWLLDNGPDGPAAAQSLCVAGDSAGGNLTLALIAWVRDAGLRQPDAAVALSPLTDSTLSSPSLYANLKTDAMLGPLLGGLAKVPHLCLLWLQLLVNRMRPNDPRVSPLLGDLAGLPPVLVHVSRAEMLYDDARRYVNKAQAAGSPVRLQSWDAMVHVWHIFDSDLPEAEQAFAEIGKFLAAAQGA